MPKMREHRMAVTVKASPFLSASQVRREVRYSIKEGVGYLGHGPDFQEVKVSVGKVGPMPKAGPPRPPADFRPLLRDVRALYEACGEEDSEEAEAIANLPSALNEALADVIRHASPLAASSPTLEPEPPRLPRAFLAGRAAFFKGEPLVQALAYGNEHQNDAWRAGWYAGHVQSFQDGAAAALETENPQPQFSPSWEAWGAGYNATQWGA